MGLEGEFIVELRPQRVWGAVVAGDIFLGGTGAGLLFLAVVLKATEMISSTAFAATGWLGLGLVGLGALLLLLDLGSPGRSWRALSRPGSSWVSRGVYSVSLFGLFGFLALLPSLPGLGDLPWGEGMAPGVALRALALALAVAVMAYTGLLLSSWPSIPFWNTPLLVVVFILYSFLGAMGLFLMVGAVEGGDEGLSLAAIALILGNGFALLTYLLVMGSSTAAAREAVRRLLRGPEAPAFILGVGLLGLLVPLVLLLIDYWAKVGAVGSPLLFLAGLFILAGGFLLRHTILKAGFYGLPL
ncbi:MAG TPA: DmsC/YnfH family molybdoenzyme membrane anchor subunit [Dehalococcoidia bacterium]|nr:DmsC/YnfH family molybdoenzyme membrane anchor subunit [Dehalococcoidia bacterium]